MIAIYEEKKASILTDTKKIWVKYCPSYVNTSS